MAQSHNTFVQYITNKNTKTNSRLSLNDTIGNNKDKVLLNIEFSGFIPDIVEGSRMKSRL